MTGATPVHIANLIRMTEMLNWMIPSLDVGRLRSVPKQTLPARSVGTTRHLPTSEDRVRSHPFGGERDDHALFQPRTFRRRRRQRHQWSGYCEVGKEQLAAKKCAVIP